MADRIEQGFNHLLDGYYENRIWLHLFLLITLCTLLASCSLQTGEMIGPVPTVGAVIGPAPTETATVEDIEVTLTAISEALDCLRDFELEQCTIPVERRLVVDRLNELYVIVENSELLIPSKMAILRIIAIGQNNELINFVRYDYCVTAGNSYYVVNGAGGIDYYVILPDTWPQTPTDDGTKIHELTHVRQVTEVCDQYGVGAAIDLDADRTLIEYEAEFLGHLTTYVSARGDIYYFENVMPELTFFLEQRGYDWTSPIFQYLSDMNFRYYLQDDNPRRDELEAKWIGFNQYGTNEGGLIGLMSSQIDFPSGFFP